MNTLEAICERVSRRTYIGEPIDDESADILNNLIKLYNRNSGMTSFLLMDGSEAFNSFLKCYGMFKNVKSLIIMKGPKDDVNLKEKTGYYGQRLVIKATQLGLGTCWVGGTFKRDDSLFEVAEDEDMFCVITIGKVPEELTFKEKALSKLIHMKTKPIEEFYESDLIIDEVPDYFFMGFKALTRAPSTRNRQKVKVFYKEGVTTISVPNDDHFDMIDLGIGKANFEIAADGTFPTGNDATFIRNRKIKDRVHI